MQIPFKDIKRFDQIANTFFLIEGERLFSFGLNFGSVNKTKLETDQKKAVAMRKGFEKLGGTFIKLGQLLSLRPDLINEAYCDEFRKLQDHVPPFSPTQAKKIIQTELKKPLNKIFKSFQAKPIAAASIGQVHKAVLKNGKDVVVKVKRPGVEDIFKSDSDILSFIAHQWEKHADPNIIRPTQIVQEFKRYTEKELDYVHEGHNIDTFASNFKNDSTVVIPKVYWEFTTPNILVMEEIKGKRIDKAIPKLQKDKENLMNQVANMVFKQIFEHGVFHADPHPGNIMLTTKKKIALLDFGIVGVFDEELQAHITDLFIAMIERDLKGMSSAMIQLGMADDDVDETALREDLREYLGKYYGSELENIKMGEVFARLITIARNHKLVLPSSFVLFGKSLVTLEGLGEEINPHFDLVVSAKPYVKSLIKKRTRPKALMFRTRKAIDKLKYIIDVFPDQANQMLHGVKKADKAIDSIHKDMELLTQEMDRSSNRMVLGILMTGFIIGGALLGDIPQIRVWGIPIFPLFGFAIAMFLGLILAVSINNEKKN